MIQNVITILYIDYIIIVQVQLGDEPECDNHIVQQLHLTSWPDHGVPNNINNLLGKFILHTFVAYFLKLCF